MVNKLDIFDLMRRADAGDFGYYASLDDEERKEVDKFIGYPMLRWMSAAADRDNHFFTVQLANQINQGYFGVREHPELQWKLLCAAGTRIRGVRRQWIKRPKPGRPPKILEDLIVHFKPNYDREDVNQFLDFSSKVDMKSLCESRGMQKDEVKKVLKAYDDWRKKRGVEN